MTHKEIVKFKKYISFDLYNLALNSDNEAFKRWVLYTLRDRGGNEDLIFSLAVNF
jgi:hypothetical protein